VIDRSLKSSRTWRCRNHWGDC